MPTGNTFNKGHYMVHKTWRWALLVVLAVAAMAATGYFALGWGRTEMLHSWKTPYARIDEIDTTVRTSPLPPEELFSMQESIDKCDVGITLSADVAVREAPDLFDLVYHAWQWDKNAMIRYVEILKHERDRQDPRDTLAHFVEEYRHMLVDAQGRPLTPPPLLRLSYGDLMQVLADAGYPIPSAQMVKMLNWSMSKDEAGMYYIPFNDEERARVMRYTRQAIAGNIKYQGVLANLILFSSVSDYKDVYTRQLYALTDMRPGVSVEEQHEAMLNYYTCAMHGRAMCMYRMSEGYYHGIGVEGRSLAGAYIWAKVAVQAAANERQRAPNSYFTEHMQTTTAQWLSKLESELSAREREAAQAPLQELQGLIDWDYKKWANEINTMPGVP